MTLPDFQLYPFKLGLIENQLYINVHNSKNLLYSIVASLARVAVLIPHNLSEKGFKGTVVNQIKVSRVPL